MGETIAYETHEKPVFVQISELHDNFDTKVLSFSILSSNKRHMLWFVFCSAFYFKLRHTSLSFNIDFMIYDLSFYTPFAKYGFGSSGIQFWNSLPAEIQNPKSLNSLKSDHKSLLRAIQNNDKLI